jgi:hypothetical protein
MIRMLIVGYCYGIRSERRLCEDVSLNLAYRWASKFDCDPCPLKPTCCPNTPCRKIPRDAHDAARDRARSLTGTEPFEGSSQQRKKVEMLFAHLKRNARFERLPLRGLSGALLAATVQNLRRLAKLVGEPPTPRMAPV